MKTSVALGFLLIVATHGATPLSKVLEMLNGMLVKGQKEVQDEKTRFAKFDQFCRDTSRDKAHSIKTGANLIIAKTAAIEQDSASVKKLSGEILELQTDIGYLKNDQKVSRRMRNKENADYQATHQDYSESIDALTRAIATLKKQNYDRKQAAEALLEVSSLQRLSASDRNRLAVFVKDPPQANAYEFQSGGVVGMLEELKTKFEGERETLTKEEMNEKHAFEKANQALTNELNTKTEEKESKESRKNEASTRASENNRERETVQANKSEDEKYKSDLDAECKTKRVEFAARSKTRADELVALQKAIEILSSDGVSGNAAKHLPKLTQMSFLQRSSIRRSSSVNKRVFDFLQSAGKRLGSSALALAAVRAQDGPFDKVTKMIQDLILKLKNEAHDETQKNAFCNKEVAENKKTREQHTEQAESLMAKSEQLSSRKAKLADRRAQLSDEIAELNAAVSEAVSMRSDEAAANKQAIADAQAGQEGVASAIQVLKDFYAGAATSTALLQGAVDDLPESWDTPYTGMQSESGGVLGMLEVLESDFARLEAETKADEDAAVREHRTFLDESEKDKAVKQTNLANTERELQRAESGLHATNKDLDDTNASLKAAQDVYEKLKPQCLETGLSYEERVQKRREEVESLKEALKILEGNA